MKIGQLFLAQFVVPSGSGHALHPRHIACRTALVLKKNLNVSCNEEIESEIEAMETVVSGNICTAQGPL